MSDKPIIKKASGETEPFSEEKLQASLRKTGASDDTIASVVNDVKSWLQDGTTTRKIYARAFSLLRKKRGGVAARYKLKKAIIELGPSGFPFEHFVGQIFKELGFEVETGLVIQGNCVQHEVDVVATGNGEQHLMECKFHNSQGKFSSVQVPLYIRSRMDDIIQKRKTMQEYNGLSFEGWVVTNTRFTSDALQFGKCSGLKLLSWDYPKNNSLKDLIERERIFPVTTLANLTRKQKNALSQKGIVLCRQLLQHPEELDQLGLTHLKRKKLMEELEALNHKN